MPKMKTRKGVAKRFKVTGSGRIKRSQANTNHILTKKSPKRKRQLRGTTLVAAVDVARIKHQMPYA